MTLQEVIDKLVRLNSSNDDKAKLFQNHITKVEIEYGDDHLLLTIHEKGTNKENKNDS